MAGFIVVILLLAGCGGGGNVPGVVDNTAPVVVEHSLDDEAGQELTQSRDMNYDFRVVGMDNMSNTLALELRINDGNKYETTLNKGNDGKFDFNADIPHTVYTTQGDYEGVKSNLKLTDESGNYTTDNRFWKKSLSEVKARQTAKDAMQEVNKSNFYDAGGWRREDYTAEIQGKNVLVDLEGAFRGGDNGWRQLTFRYESLGDNLTETFQNKIYDNENVSVFNYNYIGGTDNGYLVLTNTNTNLEQTNNSLEAAFDFIQTHAGLTVDEQPITFECPVLEQAVRDADGYTGEPTGPIYPSDVLGITRLYYQGSTSDREADSRELETEREKEERYQAPLNQENQDHYKQEQNMTLRAKITSLEGIQYLLNLESLDITENKILGMSSSLCKKSLIKLKFFPNQKQNPQNKSSTGTECWPSFSMA